jgi:hypothetical protein
LPALNITVSDRSGQRLAQTSQQGSVSPPSFLDSAISGYFSRLFGQILYEKPFFKPLISWSDADSPENAGFTATSLCRREAEMLEASEGVSEQ